LPHQLRGERRALNGARLIALNVSQEDGHAGVPLSSAKGTVGVKTQDVLTGFNRRLENTTPLQIPVSRCTNDRFCSIEKPQSEVRSLLFRYGSLVQQARRAGSRLVTNDLFRVRHDFTERAAAYALDEIKEIAA